MYHKDCCGHGEGCYVGSLKYFPNYREVRKLDVYVYGPENEQEICIRYGSEHPEYLSPGSLIDLIRGSGELNLKVIELLKNKGSITWIPRTS